MFHNILSISLGSFRFNIHLLSPNEGLYRNGSVFSKEFPSFLIFDSLEIEPGAVNMTAPVKSSSPSNGCKGNPIGT